MTSLCSCGLAWSEDYIGGAPLGVSAQRLRAMGSSDLSNDSDL